MIQSMTGFGKATGEFENKKITVEIKSLNSKQLDLSVRMPNLYKKNEMGLRNSIARRLERGKIDFLIYVENTTTDAGSVINKDVLKAYHTQIMEASEVLGVEVPKDWFQVLLRMPDVLKQEIQEADDAEWNKVITIVEQALEQIIDFRKQEGAMLQKIFEEKIESISKHMIDIEPYETERIEKVKVRIFEALKKLEDFDYDKNRFEQEMIYYIEKLDINEEKARLNNHLKYFLETLNTGNGQGKKLGFIVQEMGREINTMGSKSNDANMQQIVVQMKDELEQIKEQILNVL